MLKPTELPDKFQDRNSSGKIREVWPDFECISCGNKNTVYFEDVGEVYQDKKSEMKFVCSRCAFIVSDDKIEKYRPDIKKQPIIRVLSSVRGISAENENLLNEFDDYREFFKADKDDIRLVYGVGEKTADKIVKKREWLYNNNDVLDEVKQNMTEEFENYKNCRDKESLSKMADYLVDKNYLHPRVANIKLETKLKYYD